MQHACLSIECRNRLDRQPNDLSRPFIHSCIALNLEAHPLLLLPTNGPWITLSPEYPRSASTFSFRSKLCVILEMNIDWSFDWPAAKGPCTQTICCAPRLTPISYLNPELRNLWENHLVLNGEGSRIRKSVPSTDSEAKHPSKRRNFSVNRVFQWIWSRC